MKKKRAVVTILSFILLPSSLDSRTGNSAARMPRRQRGRRGFDPRPVLFRSDNSIGRVPVFQTGDVGSIPTHCIARVSGRRRGSSTGRAVAS